MTIRLWMDFNSWSCMVGV